MAILGRKAVLVSSADGFVGIQAGNASWTKDSEIIALDTCSVGPPDAPEEAVADGRL
jgi:hypothetical protein